MNNIKEEILLEKECDFAGNKLFIKEKENKYTLEYADKIILSCEGDYALPAITTYFKIYYNQIKHFLYPKYPYPNEKLREYVKYNENLFEEIKESKKEIIKDKNELFERCLLEYEYREHY